MLQLDGRYFRAGTIGFVFGRAIKIENESRGPKLATVGGTVR